MMRTGKPVNDRSQGKLIAVMAFAAAVVPHAGAATFFAISADLNTFVPNQLSSVTSAPQAVVPAATLGDGSLGFNGGLTTGPGGALYGIANDSTGAGSLYSIQSDGTLSLVGAAGGLGFGFLGGLAFNPGNSTFYAAVNDTLGNTTLNSITTGGSPTALGVSLGTGFSGLAFDTANSLFYGIGNDNTGFSTLFSFTEAGPVNTVGGLGFGFGALTYDAAGDVLWAIGPVNNSGSQLFQVSPAGALSAPFFTLGDGFVELAVTQAPAVGSPEPGVTAMTGAGLIGLGFFLRRNK
jgi:hypothetical protein